MIKVSENMVIKSIDTQRVVTIQSTGDYDYRETLEVPNEGKLWICVNSDKFISLLDDRIAAIRQEASTAIVITSDSEYRLPILRERGLLISKPEVNLPDDEPTDKWSYDFSKKSINTNTNSNSVSMASMFVVIGKDVVARNVNNVLEKYGDSSTAITCISPNEYSLLQRLGKAEIEYYSTGELKVSSEVAEVRIKKTKPKIDLEGLEKRLTSSEEGVIKVNLSDLKLKTMSKFVLEKILVTFKTGSVTLVSETAKKVFNATDLVVTGVITLEVLSKDLRYLTGEITISVFKNNNRKSYIIRSTDKEKTVYLMVKEYEGEIKW